MNGHMQARPGSGTTSTKEDDAAFMRFAFRGRLQAKYTVVNLGFGRARDVMQHEKYPDLLSAFLVIGQLCQPAPK